MAESAAPIRRTKPQLQLFIPWCAGDNRDGRLVRKWAFAPFLHALESLSQKPDTPKVVDSWMPVFARMTVLSAVFPPFSLHKTLESVCPASREPSQGIFETTSLMGED